MVVFGFPYLDTLKLCQRTEIVPAGHIFYGYAKEEDYDSLRALCVAGEVAAVLTELPSNPLLQVYDMNRLREITNESNVPFLVDETISTFSNIDLLKGRIFIMKRSSKGRRRWTG